ncbi:uncharacterized protein LOC126746815 [Anthonomus grandis grandis]|uniref:uncharacterized protein LOC126746815 n=1 Tax=Anthonomus grandis grandis TaxID=2921223 RepID=UPI0021655593|nr:uncharacterized protein LOC126746815 [Anthonomus grandis grandis]
MVIPEVEEILIKYKPQEEKINEILQIKNSAKHGLFMSSVELVQRPKLSPEEARDRNRQIMKEIEFVKGNLRSKSIFSPSELQWEKVCDNYQKNPSLPVTTWHCRRPVFV